MLQTRPISEGKLKGLDNLFFQMIFKFSNLVLSNGSTVVRNVIHMAQKWLFFAKKITKIAQQLGALPMRCLIYTKSLSTPFKSDIF